MSKKYFAAAFLTGALLLAGCSDEKASEKGNGGLNIAQYEDTFSEKDFKKAHPDYVVTFDDEKGMESITVSNHDPFDFKALPNYQEVVQYGFVSLQEKEEVYAVDIFVKDTDEYYAAEFDKETKELLTEEGKWVPENGDLEGFVQEKLAMIDEVLNK